MPRSLLFSERDLIILLLPRIQGGISSTHGELFSFKGTALFSAQLFLCGIIELYTGCQSQSDLEMNQKDTTPLSRGEKTKPFLG